MIITAKKEFKNFEKLEPSIALFAKHYKMTNREKDVLEVILKQKVSAEDIAIELGISKNTVRIHLRNINNKLQVNSKSELLGKFIEFSVNNVEDPNQLAKRKELNILLTDDDESFVELMKKASDGMNFKVNIESATDAEAMIQHLHNAKVMKTGYKLPNFILLDLSMPGMNGFEALSIVKSDPVLNKVPVIVFSSSVAKEDVSNTYALGANSFVTKPGNYRDLKDLMGTICHYWGQVEALTYY